MKGFLNLLAKAKLIELSDEERALAEAASAAATGAAPAAADSSPDRPPPAARRPSELDDPLSLPPLTSPPVATAAGAASTGQATDDFEGVALADIFAAAGVADSPYPAEKLLRLLAGLRAMDAATRKAAVLAMDAADDNWQIADSVSDAEQKIAALEAYKHQLTAQIDNRALQTGELVNQIKLALDQSTAAIRKQISELEQLLEREVTRAAQETTSVEAGLRQAREAAAREIRRLDGEIERLREIPATFKAA
ncbi:MAG: hypothetical protein RKP46_12685 [Candidatus Accumulibacter sp.]|uniref:hypothetical protein n=1 Tax=Accumulibacter sp. TaxID=2053492 RepID=UPI0028781C66|nr:hypothetical protein [Accumulibacter sp.]MDS4015184.1 hypothetical protein [Accumulibacter sp.]